MKHGDANTEETGQLLCPYFGDAPKAPTGGTGGTREKGDPAWQADIPLVIAEHEVDNIISEPESIWLGSAAFVAIHQWVHELTAHRPQTPKKSLS